MPPIARQQTVKSWVIRQPPIKAIAYNVLSETIGSVRNVQALTNLVIAAGLLGQLLVPLTVKLLIQVVNLVVIIHVQVVTL